MNPWKVLGLAGLAGVAAAGVIITREQRQRTQLAPEEIRARLHERLDLAPGLEPGPASAPAPQTWGTVADVPARPTKNRRWLPRRRRPRGIWQ